MKCACAVHHIFFVFKLKEKKMSAVLEYYTIFEKEERLSVWKICSSEISGRGAATKNFKERKVQEDKNGKSSVTQSLLTAEFEKKEEVSSRRCQS